jgi:putative membrane protein
LIELLGKQMTWNRSALLATACTVFGVIITISGSVISLSDLPLFYAASLGFIFGIRIFVLVAIADYRVHRMIIPAATQSLAGVAMGWFLFKPSFVLLALILHIVFGGGFIILIWLMERPFRKAFNIRMLNFINTFIAHLTDGSKKMEDFFREMGEEVYVPQVSIFFRRKDKRGLLFTVPNVHPGPIGEIGGGNLPRCFQEGFEDMVMVTHGAATHDFNLVSEDEIIKLITPVRDSMEHVNYSGTGSLAKRYHVGSVKVLAQVFGDTLLLVSTRSPERTEDLDFNIGMAIMSEGHRAFPHVGFVDAHNCLTGDISYVTPASMVATEYLRASNLAFDETPNLPRYPLFAGIAHVAVPFTREEGFGDLGIQALVVRVNGQTTAYVLFDGNNMHEGVREVLRDRLLSMVDEAEIMTTDSHVVNTVTGKNPVGMHVPAEEIIPFLDQALQEALADLSSAEAGGSTIWGERVVVFGSQRIAQLASTVSTMLLFIPALSAAILLLAFLLSFIAYLVIG